MADQKAAEFRESLKDVAVVAEKLSLYCDTAADLIGMVQLALENDGQLLLLMKEVTATKK